MAEGGLHTRSPGIPGPRRWAWSRARPCASGGFVQAAELDGGEARAWSGCALERRRRQRGWTAEQRGGVTAGSGSASGISWRGRDLAPSFFLTAPAVAAATSGFLLFKAATWLVPQRRSEDLSAAVRAMGRG